MTHWAGTARGRAVYARQARARFDAGEAELLPVVKDAIDRYLTHVRQRFTSAYGRIDGSLRASAADDDFTDDDYDQMMDTLDRAELWPPILDATIMPALRTQLEPIIRSGMNVTGAKADLVAWRNQWLADRRQVLVNIPDQITSELRTALRGAAAAAGTSVDDARLLTQQMLDDGWPSWAGRAQLIARTETVGANNQGSLASMTSIANATGVTATKTWLATDDDRTREDHADVDGTTVPITDMFNVGGDDMNGPGDASGGPEQVVNCRCSMTYDFPNGETQEVENADDLDDAAADLQDATETQADDETTDDASLTAAADPPKGVAVMAGLHPDDAARLYAGAEAAEDMHCTLGYLALPAAELGEQTREGLMAALAPVAARFPMQADSFATAHLNPDDPERDPCAVVLVQGGDLQDAHDAVTDACATQMLAMSDTFPTWVPHVTIAYNADPSVIPDGVVGTPLTFDRLILGWGGTPHVVDPADDNDPDTLTAAPEAPMTAPAPAPEATGGDTAAPAVSDAALEPEGITWSGPLCLLNTPSSDGRVIAATGGTVRPLPQPLSWQKESSEYGHEGSVVVGRILAVEARGNVLWGSGDWLDPNVTFEVMGAMAQVDADTGFVSVDLAVMQEGFADQDGQPIDPVLYDGDETYAVALQWELGGATIVSFPAFADARITNEMPPEEVSAMPQIDIAAGPTTQTFAGANPETPTISDDGASIILSDGSSCAVGDPVAWAGPDGTTIIGVISGIDAASSTVSVTPPVEADGTQPPDESHSITDLMPVPDSGGKPAMEGESSLLASAALDPYTKAFFADQPMDGPTPLTLDPATGRVYGHVSVGSECHLGKLAENGTCVTPPKDDDFSYFNITPLPMDDGSTEYVGRITVGTGHAGPGGFRGAIEHYDNSGTQTAVVRAYRDEANDAIAVVGQVIHESDPKKVQEMALSPLSGDWRRTRPGGPLHLVAALAVNVPGFRVRPIIGRVNGEQTSLVASGVVMHPPARTLNEVVLPSGRTMAKHDFESLVAATMEALDRRETVRLTVAGDTRMAMARARLALLPR